MIYYKPQSKFKIDKFVLETKDGAKVKVIICPPHDISNEDEEEQYTCDGHVTVSEILGSGDPKKSIVLDRKIKYKKLVKDPKLIEKTVQKLLDKVDEIMSQHSEALSDFSFAMFKFLDPKVSVIKPKKKTLYQRMYAWALRHYIPLKTALTRADF